jgi:integrase
MISEVRKMNLLELSKKWKEEYDEHGLLVERREVFDKHQYYVLQHKLAKIGAEALADFEKWLVVEMGLSEEAATRTRALCWVALYSTGANPIEKLRANISWYYKIQLRSALGKLAAWIQSDPDSTPEDRAWARKVVNGMADTPVYSDTWTPRIPRKVRGVPKTLSEDDYVVLLEVVERRHKRQGFRTPWARPLCRIVLLAAASTDEVVYIERDVVLEALTDKRQGRPAGLPLWKRGQRSRMVPLSLVEDELLTLAQWPAEWGTVADIVAPLADDNRMTTAAYYLRREWTAVCTEAGVDRTTPQMLRWRAAHATFKATKDYVLVQQMFGIDIPKMKRYLWEVKQATESPLAESSAEK